VFSIETLSISEKLSIYSCNLQRIQDKFNGHGPVHGNNILIYTQQDATLHSLFYLKTALHVSGVTITHHQERKQLYLQHLVFVTPLLLPAAMRQVAVTVKKLGEDYIQGICHLV
jgi:hypothetical protein